MTQIHLPPDLAHAVSLGQITQHRRPVDGRQPRVVRRTHIGGTQTHVDKPWAPTAGETIPIRRATDGAVKCHTELTDHWREPHSLITTDDLTALGCATLADHARRWIRQQDPDWLWAATADQRTPEHTLTTAAALLDDPVVLERFEARWAAKPVWVLTLQIIAEPLEYLAPAGQQRGANEHGHTHSQKLAIDDAHHVDPDDLAWHWRDRAAKPPAKEPAHPPPARPAPRPPG